MTTPSIGPAELTRQLETLLEIKMPVFIHGSPGIGKSYIVHDLAAKHGWQISDVRLSQLDAVDLRGVPAVENGATKWMPPSFFPEEGEGILFLDELNSAPPSVQAAVYQLILDRKVGEYHLPDGWRIVCAGNRTTDRGIVFRLPSPLANRMVHLVAEARFDDYKTWAIENGVHPYVIAFLGFRPDLLSLESPKDSETNPAFATPRSWTMLSSVLQKNDAVHTIHPLVYGAVGYAAGTEFLAFLKVFNELPDVDAILAGNAPEELPQSPGALYALTAALVERFDGSEGQGTHLLAFSKALATEFCVMLIRDAVVKHDSISAVPAFDEWVETYGEYVV